MIPDPDTKVGTDHLLAELAACRAEILRLRDEHVGPDNLDALEKSANHWRRMAIAGHTRIAELEAVLSDTADELERVYANGYFGPRSEAAVDRVRAALEGK